MLTRPPYALAAPHIRDTTTKRTKASTAITRRVVGPAKSNSRRWTRKELTWRWCFPPADGGGFTIRTTPDALARPWHAPTTTGFMTFARPTRLGCLALE